MIGSMLQYLSLRPVCKIISLFLSILSRKSRAFTTCNIIALYHQKKSSFAFDHSLKNSTGLDGECFLKGGRINIH